MKIPVLLIGCVLVAGLVWAFGGFGTSDSVGPGETSDATVAGRSAEQSEEAAERRMGRLDRLAVEIPASGALREGQRSVEIRVLDPDDQPAAGVKLTLFRLISPWPERRAEALDKNYTNDDGLCRFSAPIGDELLVEAIHEEYARAEALVPAELTSRTVRLEPGFEITGSVTLGRNGTRASNVAVTLEPGPFEARRARTVRTDQSGRFRFRNVSAGVSGVVRVTARHEQFAPVTETGIPVGSGQVVRLAFRDLSARMVGEVRGIDGRPIDGAVIAVYPSTAWNAGLFEPHRARSGAEGTYAISGLREGAVRVVVRHPEYSTVERTVSLHARSNQEFELFPRARVAGKLDGEVAVPFESLQLRLRTESGQIARCMVQPDGSFRFEDRVSVGKAALSIENGRAAFAASLSREHWLSIEAGVEPLDLELRDPSALVGRIVDPRGEPVVGAEIAVARSRLQPLTNPERFWATTDETGSFRLTGLPQGPTRLSVFHPEHANLVDVITVEPPGTETTLGDLVLADPLRITGQVLQGGRPLPGVSVFARCGELIDSAVSRRDGRFDIRSLPPGKYRLFARYASRLESVDGTLQIGPDMPAGDITIEFPRVRRLRFRVVDLSGEPVSNATLKVVATDGQRAEIDGLLQSASDEQGFAEVELPEDLSNVALDVDAPHGAMRQRFPIDDRESARSTPQELRMSLLPRARLSARLRLPRKSTAKTAVLRLIPLDVDPGDQRALRQRVIESRVVELAGGRLEEVLPAGRSMLTIEIPGFRPFVKVVTLDPRQENRLRMIQLLSGARFEGRVVDAQGNPIPGAFVHRGRLADLFEMPFGRSVGSGLAGLASQTDAEGRFRLRGIGPRSNQVVVAAPGYTAQELRLSLPEDLVRPREITLQKASSVVFRQAKGTEGRLIGLYHDDQLFDIAAPDEEGEVRFRLYIPGKYTVSEYTPSPEHRIEIIVGSGTQEFSVVELEDGRLQVTR